MPGIETVVLFWCFVAQHHTQTDTPCTQGTSNTSSLSLHLPIPTYISPPVLVSNLRLNSQASAQREPIDNHPSFLPRQRVNRPIRLLFSPGFDLEA